MSMEENKVELMRKYPLPETWADVSKYTWLGYGIFGIFLVAVVALTLHFA